MPGEGAERGVSAEQNAADALGWQQFTTDVNPNLFAGAEWGYEPAEPGGMNSVKEALAADAEGAQLKAIEDVQLKVAEDAKEQAQVEEASGDVEAEEVDKRAEWLEAQKAQSEAAQAEEWAAVDELIRREAEEPAVEHGDWVGKDGAPKMTFEVRQVLLDYWEGLAGREGAQYGGEMQSVPDVQQLYDEAAEFLAKEELGLDRAAFDMRVITAVATTLKRMFDEKAAELSRLKAGEQRALAAGEAAQGKDLPEGYDQTLFNDKKMDMRQILGRFYDENPKLKWDARGAELSGDETIAWSLALEPQEPGTLNLTMLFDQYPRRAGEGAQEYTERLKRYAVRGTEREDKGEWRAEQSREFVPVGEVIEGVAAEQAEDGERLGLLKRVWQKVHERGAFRRVMRRASEAFIRAMMLPVDDEDFAEMASGGSEDAEKAVEPEVKAEETNLVEGQKDVAGLVESAEAQDGAGEKNPVEVNEPKVEDNGSSEVVDANNLPETKADQPADVLMGEYALVALNVEANLAGLEQLRTTKTEYEHAAVRAAFAGDERARRHYEEKLELVRPALSELTRKARLGEIT